MSRLTIVLTVLALVAGCGNRKAPAPPPVPTDKPDRPSIPTVDEVEPNNDSKSAQTVTTSTAIHASLADGPKPDEDWYKLAGTKPQKVRFEANAATALEFAVTVYDGDHNKLLHVQGSPSVIIPTIMCRPVCFFRVAATKKETGDYTATIIASDPAERDEQEPNNRYVDAQTFPAGGAVDGYLFPADDQDWYKLVPTGLKPNQVLSVTLTPPADVLAEILVARLSDQATLATYRAAETGATINIRDLAAPQGGETGYYLVVRSGWAAKNTRTSDAKAAYTLEVKPMDGTADLELEPNNDVAHATVIDLAAPKRTGYLAPKGDVDWYTFTTTQPSIVRADVTGLDKVRLILSVIDPAKKDDDKHNELAKNEATDMREPVAVCGVAVPAGQNFLKVETAYKQIDTKWVHDYENVTDPYTLTLTVDADDGSWEREPNNEPEKATPVEVGKEYKGFIQPPKDVDFFKLELKEAQSVAIAVSAVPKLDLGIKVFDASRQEGKDYAQVGAIDKKGVEQEERLVVPFEPGTYFIEISEKGREANAQKPYVLSLK